ncbi:MAG: phage protein D [Bacteroidia bacterium]|jgi:phage protein D
MPTSPVNTDTNIVSFSIKVDGKSIADTIEVTSLSVEIFSDGTSHAEITVRDGGKIDPFIVSNSKTFKIGSNVEVGLGYENKTVQVFKGSIVSNDNSMDESHGLVLTIDCVAQTEMKPTSSDHTPKLKLTFGRDVLDFQLSQFKNDLEADKASVEGFLLFQGSSKADPNEAILLQDFAQDYTGAHVIKRVHHLVSDGQWTTEVEI